MATMDFAVMPRYVDIWKNAEQVAARDHGSKGLLKHTLVDMAGLRSFLLSVRQGVTVPEHTVSPAITIQLLFGGASVGTRDERYELQESDVIALQGGVPHDVKASQDSVLLVTMGGCQS
jgi:quercetin dioxygenase-like cupin family protein